MLLHPTVCRRGRATLESCKAVLAALLIVCVFKLTVSHLQAGVGQIPCWGGIKASVGGKCPILLARGSRDLYKCSGYCLWKWSRRDV